MFRQAAYCRQRRGIQRISLQARAILAHRVSIVVFPLVEPGQSELRVAVERVESERSGERGTCLLHVAAAHVDVAEVFLGLGIGIGFGGETELLLRLRGPALVEQEMSV